MPGESHAFPPGKLLRSALRYHGGKFRLADRLIQLFPDHRVYTEVYGGGASVLLCKPRCYSEIYNDLDGEVVNVFRVLQNRRTAARLRELLTLTPFARQEFELSYRASRGEIERARRTIIRSFMGFGSDSISRTKASRAGFNTRISSTMSTGFRWNSNRSGTTGATDWRNFPDWIPVFCDRLQGVTIENRDAESILRKIDRRDALHYVDPPYPMSVRSAANGSTNEHSYRWEMTDADHERLARLLHECQGMVIISSYPGPLYEKLFADWKMVEWTGGQFCSANSQAQKRTERVYLNRAAWDGRPQPQFEWSEPVPAPQL
jgi:DNA adenine methylase